jgi:hypothetical protein
VMPLQHHVLTPLPPSTLSGLLGPAVACYGAPHACAAPRRTPRCCFRRLRCAPCCGFSGKLRGEFECALVAPNMYPPCTAPRLVMTSTTRSRG